MVKKEQIFGRDFRLVILNLVALLLVSAFKSTAATTLWEDDSKNIENLIKVAQNVTNFHPNSRFYGLGKKPAWILKTMQLLSAERPKTTDTFHHFHDVPFSESFEEEERQVSGNYTIVYSKILPKEEEILHYRMLLREVGLDPVEIYSQYQLFKRKTVIVDFTYPDRLVVLFTKIIQDWAKAYKINLEKALKVVTVSQLNSTLPVRYLFVDQGDMFLTCQNVYGDSHLLESLANATEETGPNSSNLLPNYAAEDWLKPVSVIRPNERVKKIVSKLTEFVKIYLKNIVTAAPAKENFISSITVTAPQVGNQKPISLAIPSMSSGRENACKDLDYYTSGNYKNVNKSAKSERSFLNIVNEPLYLILTYNTTGVHTLNRGVYTLLSEEYSSIDMLEVNKKSLFDFIMDSISVEGSIAKNILATVCKLRYSQYHHGLNSKFVEEVVKARLESIESGNSVDESTMILRTSPNDTDILQEIDFQLPSVPLLPAFLSICAVQVKRAKRDVTSNLQHVDPYENFRDNPFYLIFTFNTTGNNTLNGNIYKHLWVQYALTSQNVSFVDFIQEELKNKTSLSSQILYQACSDGHSKDAYHVNNVDSNDKNKNTEAPPEEEGIFHKLFVSYPLGGLNWLGVKACQAKLVLTIYGIKYLDSCYSPHGPPAEGF